MKARRFLSGVFRAMVGKRQMLAESASLGMNFELSDEDLLQSYEESCSWPDLYYDKIQSLIELSTPSRIVEIGVAYGYHARHILSNNSYVEYVGIDPYVAGYDEEDLFFQDVAKLFRSTPNEAMNRLYRTVAEVLKREFGSRVTIHREESVTASKRFEDGSLPFVFVDGDHRYAAVLADLTAWWPKISHGGVLCGDDFQWPGVRKAALDFFQSAGQGLFLLESPDNDHISFFAAKPAVRDDE
jgi:predicted O-methyltransferase YrrM